MGHEATKALTQGPQKVNGDRPSFCYPYRMRNHYYAIPVLLVLGLPACKTPQPKTPSSDADPQGDTAKGLLAERFVSAVDLGEKFDELLESPRVSEAGNRLWARLENDPELGAQGNAYLARTFSKPEFIQALQAMMVNQMGGEFSEEKFNAHFDQRIDTLIDHPEADALWDAAVETPRVERAIEVWSRRVSHTPELATAILSFATESHWREVWRQRMAPTRSDEALIQWLTGYIESDRAKPLIQALGGALIEDPLLEQLLIDLIDHPVLFRILKGRLLVLIQSPDFLNAADRCLLSLLEGRPFLEQLDALRALIQSEALTAAMGGLFVDASREPALNALISATLVQLVENLRANEDLAKQLTIVET